MGSLSHFSQPPRETTQLNQLASVANGIRKMKFSCNFVKEFVKTCTCLLYDVLFAIYEACEKVEAGYCNQGKVMQGPISKPLLFHIFIKSIFYWKIQI